MINLRKDFFYLRRKEDASVGGVVDIFQYKLTESVPRNGTWTSRDERHHKKVTDESWSGKVQSSYTERMDIRERD